MNKKFQFYTIYTTLLFTFLMLILSSSLLLYSWPSASKTIRFAFIIILAEISCSFIFILIYKSIFTKTSSPEIFFFIIALGGVPFEAFRTLVYPAHILSKLYLFYNFLPRMVYFGKLITAMTLFISGLFSTGFSLQKQRSLLGLAFLLAFLLATTVPIDFSVNGAILLPGSRSPYIMQNILYSFYILACLNYFTGALIKRDKEFVWAGIGTAFFTAGIELIFPLHTGAVLFAGFGFFLSGLILFSFGINKIYSWI